jgi:hypothetical protein
VEGNGEFMSSFLQELCLWYYFIEIYTELRYGWTMRNLIYSIRLFIIFLLLVVVSSERRKDVLVCPMDSIEPTFWDILAHMVPAPVSFDVPGIDALSEKYLTFTKSMDQLDVVKNLGSISKKALATRLPVKSFIGDGVFTISFLTGHGLFGFSDVYFVYRMNIFAQYFCSFPAVSGYFQSVCHCTAANFEWDDGQQRDGNVYCVKSSICTDKNAREGLCKLTVNPFADGCMLISTNSFKGYFDEAEQQRVRASVSYALTVPSVADIGTALFSDPSSASASQSRSRSTSQDAAAEQLLWKALETIAHYLGVFFSYCPMYIVNCLLGYALVSNARELADEAWMQLVVQCIYGLFLAVLVIAYVLYWYDPSLLFSSLVLFYLILRRFPLCIPILFFFAAG